MTEKQKRCIDYICNTLNIEYTGTTVETLDFTCWTEKTE